MPTEQPPGGTVTFLFTDIEGSTKLWDAHSELMRTSLARHDAIMRSAVFSSGGYVFKTIGDAFCVAFATANQAVQAALSAQIALNSESWPLETPIKVRMALHTGTVESRDDDYFGPPLNRVARVMATAHGGQSLITLSTYELVRDTLPLGTTTKELGSHQLKDLARPELVFQLIHSDLPAEFPPLRSLSNQPNNLPLQLTSFVGREREIQRVKTLLENGRLITLTGSGGSGKTRLSMQIAADQLEQFSEGAWLTELASLSEGYMVSRTVANVLGVAENPGQDFTKAIAAHIGQKPLLLILDNCEHLIEECAILADALLKTCPRLKILATSREPLGISGETVFRVPPLSVPDLIDLQTPETLSQFESVRLFIDRALQADSNFIVTNENAPAMASLCYRLDGIPLAIELAAARVRTLAVEQIDARLDQRFRLLTGGSRAALPRQQTLRSLIDWSYDLLQLKERKLLQRLSVFAGGWALDSAEIVCADVELEGWEISEMVLALVDKSLVVAQEHQGVSRLGLLESVREYAKERLTESGSTELYQDRHFQCFAALGREALPHLRGPEQKVWLERLQAEMDNLRAALARGIGTPDGLSLCGDLWWFWYQRGHFTEGRAWLAEGLDRNPRADIEVRALAFNGAGVLAEAQGDFEEALRFHLHSLELNRLRGARWFEAMSLNNIGNVYGSSGDFETAGEYWMQGLEIWRAQEAEGTLTDSRGIAAALDNLGNVATSRGKLHEARNLYKESLEMRRAQGNLTLIAYSLMNVGAANTELEDYVSAQTCFRESLDICVDIQDQFGTGHLFYLIASLACPTSSITLLARANRIRRELGTPLTGHDEAIHDSTLQRARDALSETEFETAWAEGYAMSLAQAVDLARTVTELPD
ncbi:MAG: tetratricopeptide repeat protein [Fimbriimonadaceae bacterium]